MLFLQSIHGYVEASNFNCLQRNWNLEQFEHNFETVPPLTEELKRKVLSRDDISAKIVKIDGRVRLVVNGKPVPPVIYHAFTGMQNHHGYYADFTDAGVDIHTRTLLMGKGVLNVTEGTFWNGKGVFNLGGVEEQLWRVLRVNPDAYILVHIWLDPYYQWGVENPDDVCLNEQGEKAIGTWHLTQWGGTPAANQRYLPSVYSSKLRADICDMVTRLVTHIENGPLGKTVIGYSLAGMNDGQWVNWAHWNMHLDDYSPAANEAFRDWIRNRYENDVDKLRSAWSDLRVTFDDVRVPPPSRRISDDIFLDPQLKDVVDYNRFYAEAPFDTIVEAAKIIKNITNNKKIVTTYYASPMNGAPSGTGLGRLLDVPWIDMFQCPSDYGVRMPGLSSGSQTIFSSLSLHNKMFIHEQDWRSFVRPGQTPAADVAVGRAPNAEAHNNMVRRDSGMQIVHGQGTWFFDIGNGHFHDLGIMKGVAEAVCAFKTDLNSNEKLEADVAFFVSERSLDFLAFPLRWNYQWYLLRRHRNSWVESGVPYHLYLQSDLANSNIDDYKVYIFLNPQYLSTSEAEQIEKLKRRGKTLVFCHGPGLYNSDDPEKNISQITGITVMRLKDKTQLAGIFLEGSHILQEKLKGSFGDSVFSGPSGEKKIIATAFSVEDENATPLATYINSNKIAIAAKDFGSWKSIFCGVPRIEPQFLNNIAKWASAWSISKPGDAVFANQKFVTIHALEDGHKKLNLKYPSRVLDLTTYQILYDKTESIEIDMAKGQTRWFSLQPIKN